MDRSALLTWISGGVVALRATLPAAGAWAAALAANARGFDPATAAGVGAATAAGVSGLLESAHGVAANILSARAEDWIANDLEEVARLFSDDPLTQLIGEAIKVVLTRERDASEGQFQAQLNNLLPFVTGYWRDQRSSLKNGDLTPAQADQITAVLHGQIQDQGGLPLATREAWVEFLRSLAQDKGIKLETEPCDRAAKRLHHELGHVIDAKARQAAEKNPRAWAAIHLQFQSRILKEVADLQEDVRSGFAEQARNLASNQAVLLLLGLGVNEIRQLAQEAIGVLQRLDGATGRIFELALANEQRGQRIEEQLRCIRERQGGIPLPPIVDLIGKSNPSGEFARLMGALLTSEAREVGVTVGVPRLSQHTVSFVIFEYKGKFCGLEPVTAIRVNWLENESREFENFAAEIDLLRAQAEQNPKYKNWVFVTPVERTSPGWQDIVTMLAQRGIKAHNFSQLEFEPWLRNCPALLARYYPSEAAKRADAQDFDGREFEGWKREFSAKVLSVHRDLQLFGFPSLPRRAAAAGEVADPKTFLLEQVFIPQKLVPRGEPESAARTAGQLILDGGCLVLLGDPGAGKTSLLRYLAMASGEGKEFGGTQCPQRVPLFLPLRDFARNKHLRPTLLEALADHARVSANLGPELVHRWHLEGLLHMGEALVFFDGLDEAGDSDSRKDVARRIRDFHQSYPACPVWVTSRSVGYDQAPLEKGRFGHFDVTPFAPDQQAAFVSQWYLAKLPRPEAEIQRGRRVAAFLESLDRAVPEIRELATNPLLLTLAIWVHDELGCLPPGRGQLYDECVKLLVHRRDEARWDGEKIALEKLEPSLKADSLRRYYTHIALRAQELNAEQPKREARGVIPETLLLSWIEGLRLPELRRHHNVGEGCEKEAREQSRVILDFSEERCGLLRFRGDGTYAFLHLSFQEHLAAERKAVVLRNRPAEVADFIETQAGKAAWLETLLLMLHHLRDLQVPDPDGSEVPFSHWLVGRLQAADRSAPPPDLRRLLGMALRDGIEFTPAQQRWILELLLADWSHQPVFVSETFKVLGQVAGFSAESRPELLRQVTEVWQRGTGITALRFLHLRVRMLGWPTDPTENEELADALLQRLGVLEGPPGELLPFLERAAELLANAGPELVSATAGGAKCVDQVRQQLLGLMRQPHVKGHKLKLRAAAGVALARVGDPRPGVSCRPARYGAPALPDIEFVDVAGAKDGFTMGSKTGHGQDNERPQFTCTLLPHDFKLSRYPVTVAQFEAFVAAGGYGKTDQARPPWWTEKGWLWRTTKTIERPEDYDTVFQTPNHPRVGVSWFEAHAFSRWLHQYRFALGVPTNWHIRLPWEAEWERAARGLAGRMYPWGSEDPEGRCNIIHVIGHTSAVGLFPTGDTKEGLSRIADLAGNVWEWCGTQWRPNYSDYERHLDNRPEGEAARCLRGGAWYYAPDFARVSFRSSYRLRNDPRRRDHGIGFRLAASPISDF